MNAVYVPCTSEPPDVRTLFNQVLFSKDSPYSDAARDKILAYADDLKARVNTPEGDADAMDRLAMRESSQNLEPETAADS